MSDPKETQSAAGGDWLDEEIEIPTLEEDTPSEPVAEEPPVEEKAEEVVAKETTTTPVEDKAAKEEDKAGSEVDGEPAPVAAETPVVDVAKEEAKKVPTQIPKKRFDQVNDRLKAAQERLREIDNADKKSKAAQANGEAPRDDTWFGQQEKAYMEAVVDGEVDKAMNIRQDIRSAEQNKFQAYADQKAEYVQKEVPQRAAVESVIGELQDNFPQLDSNDESFEPELIGEVLGLQRSYIQNDKLLTPAAALQKAAARLGMDLDADPVAEPVPAPVIEKPAKLSDAAGAVAASNAQPPEIGSRAGYDNGEDEIDFSNFTEEDMDKLPASKLRELRGDGGRG
jgi:hypothetical protein